MEDSPNTRPPIWSVISPFLIAAALLIGLIIVLKNRSDDGPLPYGLSWGITRLDAERKVGALGRLSDSGLARYGRPCPERYMGHDCKLILEFTDAGALQRVTLSLVTGEKSDAELKDDFALLQRELELRYGSPYHLPLGREKQGVMMMDMARWHTSDGGMLRHAMLGNIHHVHFRRDQER